MEYLNWVVNNYQLVIITVLSLIGGASVALAAIAPLTKTTKDDRVLAVLNKAHSFLSKLALQKPK